MIKTRKREIERVVKTPKCSTASDEFYGVVA